MNPDMEGMVMTITYFTNEYFLYMVQWADTSASQHKEVELINEHEFITGDY